MNNDQFRLKMAPLLACFATADCYDAEKVGYWLNFQCFKMLIKHTDELDLSTTDINVNNNVITIAYTMRKGIYIDWVRQEGGNRGGACSSGDSESKNNKDKTDNSNEWKLNEAQIYQEIEKNDIIHKIVRAACASNSVRVKDHFGWLNDDTNIIDVSFEYDFDNIPNYHIFTINAHDRPDIISNDEDTISSTGSNVFLIRIKYGSEFDYVSDVKISVNVVYVYCRTSYVDDDNINSQGVGVQYCLYDNCYNWYESGANILTHTLDIRGDAHVQTDHYIPISGSHVIQQFFASVESGQTTNHYTRNIIY